MARDFDPEARAEMQEVSRLLADLTGLKNLLSGAKTASERAELETKIKKIESEVRKRGYPL